MSERATGTPSHLAHFTGFLKDASKNIGFETDFKKEQNNYQYAWGQDGEQFYNRIRRAGRADYPGRQAGGWAPVGRTSQAGQEHRAGRVMEGRRRPCSPWSPNVPGMAGSEGCGMGPGWWQHRFRGVREGGGSRVRNSPRAVALPDPEEDQTQKQQVGTIVTSELIRPDAGKGTTQG